MAIRIGGLTFKEFMSRGMREMNLSGASQQAVRDALRSLAREWKAHKAQQSSHRPTAAEIASRILGGR